jgi:hypothetical protein
MSQEDRILLEKLNEVIGRNPRLAAYRLSLRSYQAREQTFLRTWLLGFIFGVMAATTSIALCHSIALQGNSEIQTDKTTEMPSQQTKTSDRQGA